MFFFFSKLQYDAYVHRHEIENMTDVQKEQIKVEQIAFRGNNRSNALLCVGLHKSKKWENIINNVFFSIER